MRTISGKFWLICLFLAMAGFSLAHAEPVIYFFNGSGADAEARHPGELITIRIAGLKPGGQYQLQAKQGAMSSQIVIRANSQGAFQTDQEAPLSGSYSGVDADGMFWSLTGDMSKINMDEGTEFILSAKGQTLAQAKLPWSWIKPDIQKINFNVKDDGFAGTLFLPRSLAPKPLVIAWSGSEGGLYTGLVTAAAFANAGYAALGLAYFGAEGLPSQLAQIPLEYFGKVLERMQKQPGVRGDQIAVTGASRGGELALLVGAMFPQVKAVVAVVPSPYLWAANVDSPVPQSAWTHAGQQFPFIRTVGQFSETHMSDGTVALNNRPVFEQSLAAAGPLKAIALTRIEAIQGPVLLIGGEDDQVWQSADFARTAHDHLRAAGRKKDKLLVYPNAGHNILVPALPTTMTYIKHPKMGVTLNLGGQPAATALAQRDSFEKTKEFLASAFGPVCAQGLALFIDRSRTRSQ